MLAIVVLFVLALAPCLDSRQHGEQRPRTSRSFHDSTPPSRSIALTFDAGSDRGFAAQILDTLKANGIHATFGMTGQWAQKNADLVKRMVIEGHVLINHSWDHPDFTTISSADMRQPAAADR